MQKSIFEYTEQGLEDYFYKLKLSALRKQRYVERMKMAECERNIHKINAHLTILILKKLKEDLKNET